MTQNLDLLKLKINALNAEPGSVVVVYFPNTYSTEALKNMGRTFSHLSDETEYNFILVPEDIKLEVLPKDVEVSLTDKKD